MKERPILFSTPMITAIIDGHKTQTRRLIKPQPSHFLRGAALQIDPDLRKHKGVPMKLTHKKPTRNGNVWEGDYGDRFEPIKCRYDADQLWVRETWKHNTMPTGWPYHYYEDDTVYSDRDSERWKPSIHMPREASRIYLEVESIHVERLQDITREDAISEGVYYSQALDGYVTDEDGRNYHHSDPVVSFCKLWISINGAESWDANPYIWVVQFKKVP